MISWGPDLNIKDNQIVISAVLNRRYLVCDS